MAGVRIALDFYGDSQLNRTLLRFDGVEDARPAWEVLADRFGRLERRQFSTEGAYASGGWAALSPRYAAWKARAYPGRPILEMRGDLKESLTRRPFGVEVIDTHRMIVGTDVRSDSGYPYGRAHQLGEGNTPRRRPVEFPEAERREWVKVLQRFIVTGRPT